MAFYCKKKLPTIYLCKYKFVDSYFISQVIINQYNLFWHADCLRIIWWESLKSSSGICVCVCTCVCVCVRVCVLSLSNSLRFGTEMLQVHLSFLWLSHGPSLFSKEPWFFQFFLVNMCNRFPNYYYGIIPLAFLKEQSW